MNLPYSHMNMVKYKFKKKKKLAVLSSQRIAQKTLCNWNKCGKTWRRNVTALLRTDDLHLFNLSTFSFYHAATFVSCFSAGAVRLTDFSLYCSLASYLAF